MCESFVTARRMRPGKTPFGTDLWGQTLCGISVEQVISHLSRFDDRTIFVMQADRLLAEGISPRPYRSNPN